MKLTTSNVVSGNIVSGKLTIGNSNIVESINLGNVNFTPSAVTVGNVSITPSAISTPQLVVGGISYTGSSWGGILDYQEFTTAGAGTWYNPYANASANASLSGSEQVLVMAWGGGGGATSGTDQGGGGGGACAIGHYKLSDLASTVSVIVGAGATGATTGGTTSFGSLNAYGGGPGQPAASGRAGAGGGGLFSAGLIGSTSTGGAGGGPVGGAGGAQGLVGTAGTFGGGGGGGGSGGNGGASIFGGAGGGGGNPLGAGGSSIFGGGGGAGSTNTPTTGAAGLSVFGGNGANSTLAAAAPGGGGCARAASPNGARGEVRVWTFGIAGTTLGAPTYSLTANTTTLYEGSSVLYTVSTTNVANNTTLYYTLNSISSSATSADFTTAVNGAVVINGGTGTFTLTANNDTDSANEAFQMDLRTISTSGSIVASNGSVSIAPLTTLSLVNATSLTDGSSASSTLNVPSGTQSGDILILVVSAGNPGGAPDITPPTGFTQLAENIGTRLGTNISYLTYSSGASFTFTLSTSAVLTAALVALRPSGTATFTTANTTTTTTVPTIASGDFPGFFFTAAMGTDGAGTSVIGTPGNTTSIISNTENAGINSSVKLSWIPDLQSSMPAVGTYTFTDSEYRTYSFLVKVAP